MKNNYIELLAPAGSYESVIAAVRCGADAIYLGGKSFSARQNAQNFSSEELKEVVRYCHLHGVKVHQAINTIAFDSQINEVVDAIKDACEAGVDALIIQDLGVAEIAKRIAPDMELHASTQMSIHTKEGAEFAKKMGFKRVVVSRELSKEQIEEICSCDIEVEAFVHGALCMSVSGQCYMSSMIGSRSANRGLCGQACRLPFSSVEGEKRCDLSLKDMSLVKNISDMCDIGVMSIKIEGRMKRPEYVAAAVSACRNAINGLSPDIDTLTAVFSRSGFTDGYFNDNLGADMFGTRQKEDVVSASTVLPTLKELYRKEKKSADISFFITLKSGVKASLSATDNEGNTVTVYGEIPEKAINRPSDLDSATKQLSKLGDTIYTLKTVEGEIDDGLIYPASLFNELRRNAVIKLDEMRITKNTKVYEIKPLVFKPENKERPAQKIRLDLLDFSQLEYIDMNEIDMITLPIHQVLNNYNKLLEFKEKVIISLPRFMPSNEQTLIKSLTVLKDRGFNRLSCNNVANIHAGQSLGFKLHGDFGLNISNSMSLEVLREFELEDAICSFELKLSQIEALKTTLPIGLIAYGALPLMLCRNCPIKSSIGCKRCNHKLTDRTGRNLPVICTPSSVEILNSDVLYMADRLNEIKNVDFITLKFYNEDAETVSAIYGEYKYGSCNTPKDFTRGLYYRGIH